MPGWSKSEGLWLTKYSSARVQAVGGESTDDRMTPARPSARAEPSDDELLRSVQSNRRTWALIVVLALVSIAATAYWLMDKPPF